MNKQKFENLLFDIIYTVEPTLQTGLPLHPINLIASKFAKRANSDAKAHQNGHSSIAHNGRIEACDPPPGLEDHLE